MELSELLQDALAQERRSASTLIARLRTQDQTHRYHYGPESWTVGRTLLLIHNESHDSLGYFQEFLHRRSPARRLQRLASEPECYEIEIVCGAAWQGPLRHLVDPPTESEIAAVKALFRPCRHRFRWKHKRERISDPHFDPSEMLKELAAL